MIQLIQPPLNPGLKAIPQLRKVWLPMLMPPLGRSGWVMMEAPVCRRLTRAWAIEAEMLWATEAGGF